MTDFIVSLGAARLEHSQCTYLAHAIGVYKDMQKWGADDELCRASLFHSIYGTDEFQDVALPLDRREELRQLIGDRAERLAYANSAMRRESLDPLIEITQDRYVLQDRITGGQIELTRTEFEDLLRVHLCDWLEQVERSTELGWNYRRDAYRKMAERLAGVALESYNEVFAREPAEG